jgi:hypothetical protein
MHIYILITNPKTGQGVEIPGTTYQDVKCTKCVAGMFGNSLGICEPCTLGETFSNVNGSINCTSCQECEGQNFSSLCDLTQDNVCISKCPDSWAVDESTRLCSKCAPGYHDVGIGGTLEEQCVECPANSYCEASLSPKSCPDIM